jgi:hypothetical protein
MPLNREQLLAGRGRYPTEAVECPELGGAVLVRVLTLGEVEEIKQFQAAEPEPLKLYPKMVAMAAVAEDGSPLFPGEDAKMITGLPWPAVDRLARAILKLNGMSPEENGEAKKA